MALQFVNVLGVQLTFLGAPITAYVAEVLATITADHPNAYGTESRIMGYSKQNGRFADTDEVVMATGIITATATGPAVELGDRIAVRLDLNVLAVSGTTPSLTVGVETSKDGVSGWTSIGTFTAATAVVQARKVFVGCDRFIRITETVSGTTPSFTRLVSGEAV